MRALAAQPSLSWVYAFVCAAYPRLDQFGGEELNGMFEALPALAGDASGGGGMVAAGGGGVATHWLDDLVQICCYELPARQAERAALTAAAAAAAGVAQSGSSSSSDGGIGDRISKRSSSRSRAAGSLPRWQQQKGVKVVTSKQQQKQQ
jgi:hypothetical protein